ncbi:MAG TPA: cadherin-like domain-containing protein, partial [Gemmataceae bacterium]|nr:cadherin-like domain-containing protein [Gemmataceae bacterium]
INVTSGPSDLVTKTLTNEMLTLNYKAGATGTADITITATDRFGATVTETFTVTVTVPNNPPSGINNAVTTLENSPYTFKQADFGFSDPNDNPANTLQAVEISSLPLNGVLTDNGTAVSTGQFISVADITANKLIFTPTANMSGPALATFTFQVQDNGGTANGGIDTDPFAKTMTINVQHVNQPPVGTSNTLNASVNIPLTLATADFGFTDPADPVANNFLAVEITTLPTTGSLTLSGSPVTAGQFISVGDIIGGNLQYISASSGSTTFTFQVQDDGGTANGAHDTDTTPRTMTVNIS